MQRSRTCNACGHLGSRGTYGGKGMRLREPPPPRHPPVIPFVQGYLAKNKTPPPRTLQ